MKPIRPIQERTPAPTRPPYVPFRLGLTDIQTRIIVEKHLAVSVIDADAVYAYTVVKVHSIV